MFNLVSISQVIGWVSWEDRLHNACNVSSRTLNLTQLNPTHNMQHIDVVIIITLQFCYVLLHVFV